MVTASVLRFLYTNCNSGGLGAQNFSTNRIHRLPALAADLGHMFVILTFSSKCESVESRSDLALSNHMIALLSLLFRKPISI